MPERPHRKAKVSKLSIATHCMSKLEVQDKRVSTWSANASKHFSHGANDIVAQF
jgi:hypothetical protein